MPGFFNEGVFKNIDEKAAGVLLSSTNTYAFVLMVILLSAYGEDVFTTKPPALFAQIEEDFHIQFPEENENKVNAALTVLTTDLPYIAPSVFKVCALAFSGEDIGNIADGGDEEIDACQVLWCLTEMSLLQGEASYAEADDLSDSVLEMINSVIDSEGEDPDEDPEEVIETIKKEPYYSQYTTQCLLELARQLRKLEVSDDIIAELLNAYNRDILELAEKEDD